MVTWSQEYRKLPEHLATEFRATWRRLHGSLPAVNPEGLEHSRGHWFPDAAPVFPEAGRSRGIGFDTRFYVLKALSEIILHLCADVYLSIYFELELCQSSEKMLLFYDNQKY